MFFIYLSNVFLKVRVYHFLAYDSINPLKMIPSRFLLLFQFDKICYYENMKIALTTVTVVLVVGTN